MHRIFACLVWMILTGTAQAQTPLPVDKTQTLRDGSYTVEGRVRIDRKTKLTILRGLTVRGSGKESVIEVAGTIKFKAPTGGKVTFENVWLEIMPECREITLSHVVFRGGGIRAHESGPHEAKTFMEFVNFEGNGGMTLEMSGGEVDLQGVSSSGPMAIRGIPRSERSGAKLDLMMLSCRRLNGGLEVKGCKVATVRNCDMGGAKSLFEDNRRLEFDGNHARSKEMHFRNTKFGGFKGSEIKYTDFRCDKLVLWCPAEKDKQQKIMLRFCWFHGLTEDEEIHAQYLEDGHDKPAENGAYGWFRQTSPVAMGLGGR